MADTTRIWTAALIVIGDEILSGRTQDRNVAQIATWLNVQGIRLREVRVVADDSQAIVEAVRRALEITPPELSADIVDRGIVMTGGGALIRGLDRLLQHETNLPIHVDEEPLTCVVRGAGRILDDLHKYRTVLVQ